MMLNRANFNKSQGYPERVIQFGEGNFLRAFADWIIDSMNKKADFNSSVVVVQPIEKGMIEKINEQDGMYTLYLKGMKDGKAVNEHSVIDCISRGINPYENYDEYLKLAENDEIRFIISNTTEAGIVLDENDKLSDKPQNSYPGKLTALLYHRYEYCKGDAKKGFIIIPCELIDRNGEKLKKIVLELSEKWKLEKDFVKWVNEANTFCCSLVDRIVPGYPRDRIQEITKELGYEDSLVDEGEIFHLWVIEGPKWIKNELPVEKCGLNVLFTDDMTPYRTRKVRILNGAHTAMVSVARLYGIETVKEAVEHEAVGDFIHKAVYEEIIPTLDLPEDELNYFAKAVIERFKNPYIKHYLMSIALNSMSKFETRVLPSILEYKKRKGKLPKRLVFSLAALIAFYRAENIKDNEDIVKLYEDLWKSYDGSDKSIKNIVTKVLEYDKNWHMNLAEIDGLVDETAKYLSLILKAGIIKALEAVK